MEVVTTSDSLATGDERRLGGRLGLVAGRPRRLGEVERAPLCAARLCRRRSLEETSSREAALVDGDPLVLSRGEGLGALRAVLEPSPRPPCWRIESLPKEKGMNFINSKRVRAIYEASDSLAARGLHDDRGVVVQIKHRTLPLVRNAMGSCLPIADVAGTATLLSDTPRGETGNNCSEQTTIHTAGLYSKMRAPVSRAPWYANCDIYVPYFYALL